MDEAFEMQQLKKKPSSLSLGILPRHLGGPGLYNKSASEL